MTTFGYFMSMLTVLFIGLKLTGHIGWPWLLVLAPLWAPGVFLLLVVVAFFVAELLREAHR